MSRRVNSRSNERWNELLKLADLDPVTFGYYKGVQERYGKFLDSEVKEEFLTSISILANLRILTEDIRNKEGKIYGKTLTLQPGQPVLIDFLQPENSRGVGVDRTTLAVRDAVYGLHLTNQGTGNLGYSVNVMGDNGTALLLANAPTKVIMAQRKTFEFIALQAIGSAAVINVAVEI
jgi:hypothetical protein